MRLGRADCPFGCRMQDVVGVVLSFPLPPLPPESISLELALVPHHAQTLAGMSAVCGKKTRSSDYPRVERLLACHSPQVIISTFWTLVIPKKAELTASHHAGRALWKEQCGSIAHVKAPGV